LHLGTAGVSLVLRRGTDFMNEHPEFQKKAKKMVSQKVSWVVTPAKAGVQKILKSLDSGFRRNDKFCGVSTFYEIIKERNR